MTNTGKRPLNAMTVDVEEHFQVSAFESVVPRESWGEFPSRVEANTDRVLDLFDELGIRATFFVLGWVAERHTGLVRQIADRGHEVGCHGYSHRLVYEQDRATFRSETMRARDILQDASGQPVDGYRAASFSINGRSLWAIDELAELGFRYDSSVFPVVHDRYGIPGAPRRIHRLETPDGAALTEVPPSTVRCCGVNLPVAGGGYLRLYPSMLTRWAVRRLQREGLGAIVYVHPWEFDPEQPRIRAPWRSRFRHYVGLNSTTSKIRDLALRFPFDTMSAVITSAEATRTVVEVGAVPEGSA